MKWLSATNIYGIRFWGVSPRIMYCRYLPSLSCNTWEFKVNSFWREGEGATPSLRHTEGQLRMRTNLLGADGVVQVVERLSSKCETLISNKQTKLLNPDEEWAGPLKSPMPHQSQHSFSSRECVIFCRALSPLMSFHCPIWVEQPSRPCPFLWVGLQWGKHTNRHTGCRKAAFCQQEQTQTLSWLLNKVS
jgi:hypothetical protein